MPLLAARQILVCGLFTPRNHMATLLTWFSDVMPLSYAVDAMKVVKTCATVTRDLIRDVVIVGGATLMALILGAATLRRQTP